jgi:hypothetical protein
MATKSKRRGAPRLAPPLPRGRLAIPGIIALGCLIALVLGSYGLALGLLFATLGTWLAVVGRHRRWKGAPEAGYVLIGLGAVVSVVALLP